MGIKPCFGAFLFFLAICGRLNGQSAASGATATETRIESWRELLRQGQTAAVADSCAGLLNVWPAKAGTRLQALTISLQANALRQQGNAEKSLVLHREALRIRRNLYGAGHPELAGSFQNIGNCLLDLGRTSEAFQVLKKAADLKERFFKSDPSKLLSTYNSLGQCCADLTRYAEAERYFRQALDIETRISGPQSADLAIRFLALADLQANQLHFDSAAALLRRALQLPLDTLDQHHETYILLLNNLGNACAAMGRPAEAIEWLQKALLRCESSLSPSGASLRGRCLLNLGNCQFDLGDFAAAEMSLRSARASLSNAPADQAAAANSFALVLRYRDRSHEAIDSFLVVYNLYLQVPPTGVNRRAAAGVCMNLGSAYLDGHAYKESLFYFQKALDLYLNLPQSAADLAACYDKIGLVYFEQNDLPATLQAWDLAASLAPNGPLGLQFAVWLHKGDWYAHQQQWDAALTAYHGAQSIVSPSGPRIAVFFPYESVQVRTAIGQLWLNRSRESKQSADWEKTLALARDAIAALEALKSNLRTDRSAIELQEAFDTPFDMAVEAALALGQTQTAWQFSEDFKINFLQQLSWQSNRESDFGLPVSLLNEERSRSRRLAYFQQLRSTGEDHTNSTFLALDDSIRYLTEAGYQFRLTLARQYPAQFKLLYAPDLPDVAAVRHRLRPDQSLLTYQWSQEKAWAFVIRSDTFIAIELAFPKTEEQRVWRFFQHCSTNPYAVQDDLRKQVFAEMCADGETLYRSLVAPVEAFLGPSVLIVPDGLLCLLPFEALVTAAEPAAHRFHRHHFWLEKHQIGYAHSAAAWLNLCHRPRSSAPFPLLAIAPNFDGNQHGLRSLRHNMAEADSVRLLTDGVVWKNAEANKQHFQAEADQYRVLLLSTHGVTNDQEPLASFVAFTPAQTSLASGEIKLQTSNSELQTSNFKLQTSNSFNDLLRVSDLYGLHLPADLVVLSACQTASGRLYRGEGMLSIARAFQFAGAKSLVASLWNVDDQHTPSLMRSFFSFLWEKRDKSTALTQAKLAYLKHHQGLDAHPYYWAGLIGIGNDEALTDLASTKNWLTWIGWSALAMGVFAAALFFYYRKK